MRRIGQRKQGTLVNNGTETENTENTENNKTRERISREKDKQRSEHSKDKEVDRFDSVPMSHVLMRRTAVGKFGGSLTGVPAFALGAAVIKQLLQDPHSLSKLSFGVMGCFLETNITWEPGKSNAAWMSEHVQNGHDHILLWGVMLTGTRSQFELTKASLRQDTSGKVKNDMVDEVTCQLGTSHVSSLICPEGCQVAFLVCN